MPIAINEITIVDLLLTSGMNLTNSHKPTTIESASSNFKLREGEIDSRRIWLSGVLAMVASAIELGNMVGPKCRLLLLFSDFQARYGSGNALMGGKKEGLYGL